MALDGVSRQSAVRRTATMLTSQQVFRRAREEMSRRTSKRKLMQKSSKAGQEKYSPKYVRNGLLVCGECGTPYKRCT